MIGSVVYQECEGRFYPPNRAELKAFEKYSAQSDCPGCGKDGRVVIEHWTCGIGPWFVARCQKYRGGSCGWKHDMMDLAVDNW